MKKRVFFFMLALVALPAICGGTVYSPEAQTRSLESDSLIMMKERVRIANELLKAISGILEETPSGNSSVTPGGINSSATNSIGGQQGVETVRTGSNLSIVPGSASVEGFPSFRPVGLRQDSIGEFVWLPDSLLAAWNAFVDAEKKGLPLDSVALAGVKALRDSLGHTFRPAHIESDYVTFRGDTIPRVLKSQKLGRFDRGLFNYLYIPKGIWSFGLTASYGELSTKDVELFDVITGMTIKGDIFSISPSMQYFIKNNVSIGLRLSYTRGSAGINSLDLEIDEDMGFNINDVHYKTESYKAAFTLRQYFGLDRGGRFGVFNDVELAFASGQSDFNRPYDGDIRRLHATTMQTELNFSPGLHVFIMKNVGFNISFGVFGFSLKNEKQYMNDVYQGSRFKSGANFRFNIFNINFGLSVSI